MTIFFKVIIAADAKGHYRWLFAFLRYFDSHCAPSCRYFTLPCLMMIFFMPIDTPWYYRYAAADIAAIFSDTRFRAVSIFLHAPFPFLFAAMMPSILFCRWQRYADDDICMLSFSSSFLLGWCRRAAVMLSSLLPDDRCFTAIMRLFHYFLSSLFDYCWCAFAIHVSFIISLFDAFHH